MRERRLRARQVVTRAGRYVYSLILPDALRRDFWYLRNKGLTYRHFEQFQMQSAAAAADLERLPTPDPSAIAKAPGPTVLCFPATAWANSSERQRLVMRAFAGAGHRCVWITPNLAGNGAAAVSAHAIGAAFDELTVMGDGADVSATAHLTPESQRRLLDALREYCFQQDLREVVCVVQHPAWRPIVERLRSLYGWKIIADLADDRPEDEIPSAVVEDQLQRLVSMSDLVVTTSPEQASASHSAACPLCLLPTTDAYPALLSAVRQLYGRATIIVVSYSNHKKLLFTLQSILEKTRYPHYDVLVVDNGGKPEIQRDVRLLAQRFPETVRYIFNGENLGFAAGNNVGLRASPDSAFLVLLNDDVIVTPGWLGGLLHHLDDRRIGYVGPVTNECGNEARIRIDYSALSQIDDFARRYTYAHDGVIFDITVLAMYCVALRQDTFQEVGELDERFRVGMFEDDDYAVRMSKAGYRVVCADDVYVHHAGSASFGQLKEEAFTEIWNANRALFEEKWKAAWKPHKYRRG